MAGNVVMVKHAGCVPQCAIAFEKLWLEAAQAFAASGAWSVLHLAEMRWSASYAGWSMRFGEEIVTQLKSRAAELVHLPLSERIPVLVHSLSEAMRKCR